VALAAAQMLCYGGNDRFAVSSEAISTYRAVFRTERRRFSKQYRQTVKQATASARKLVQGRRDAAAMSIPDPEPEPKPEMEQELSEKRRCKRLRGVDGSNRRKGPLSSGIHNCRVGGSNKVKRPKRARSGANRLKQGEGIALRAAQQKRAQQPVYVQPVP
jgi:hypothetical protein